MRVGSVLMFIGGALFVVGILLRLFPGLFSWFGNLPGDITVEGESSRVFIPIGSMIALSIGLTLIANLVAALLRDR